MPPTARAESLDAPTDASPYRLTLLGEWDLRGPDGRQIQSVLAQPKRLCLLAYLAMQAEPVTRSSVVALFWPDTDEEKARNALSQALFYLRRSMGNTVIENLAGDRIRVARDVVSFDAREALEAHRRGEWPTDADVEASVFFEGWNADDNQPVQEWLDGLRRHFIEIEAERPRATPPEPSPVSPDVGDDAPIPRQAPLRVVAAIAIAALTALVVIGSIGIGWMMRGDRDTTPLGTPTADRPGGARIAVLQPMIFPDDGLPDAVADAIHANLVHRFIEAYTTPGAVISIPFESTRYSTQSILEATTGATTPLRVVEILVQVGPDEVHVNATLFSGAGSLVVERAVQCTYTHDPAATTATLPGRIADDIITVFRPEGSTEPTPSGSARELCR